MKYKKIELLDIPELAELYIETFNSEPWNDKWTKETAEKRLHQMINVEGFYGLCAYKDDKLCGMILGCEEQFYNGKTFNIREFCVSNKLRGNGLGTKIFNKFEEELRKKQIKEIYLVTVRGDMTEHFYHKQKVSNREQYVVMGKEI